MKNTYIFLIFIFTSTLCFATQSITKPPLEITWFGTTCLNISDGETSLFFDPFINHPRIWDIISLQEYSPNQEYLSKWLTKIDTTSIKAIFLSHTHFDHALDLVGLAKLAPQSMVYGSPSASKILSGGDVTQDRFTALKSDSIFQIGSFKIRVLPAIHAPHFLDFSFGSGSIEHSIPPNSALYTYKMGTLYNFLIEHPMGNILFHPSGQTTLLDTDLKRINTPLVIQGIYSRKSDDDLIQNIFKKVNATDIIAVHYDNFLKPLEDGVKPMIFSNFKEFKESLKKHTEIKLHQLKYGEVFKYP